MNFLEKILSFFKDKFKFNKNIEMIEAPKEQVYKEIEDQKNNFEASLKVELPKNKNKCKVEVPICVGDGLGIQEGIKY